MYKSFSVVLATSVVVIGCAKKDPLYCDEETECAESAERPYCDVAGEYPASEGIGNTCIPYPWDAAIPDALTDAGSTIDGGLPADAAAPVVPLDGTISAGWEHTCAVVGTGAMCWGAGGKGATGYAQNERIGDDEQPVEFGKIDVGFNVKSVGAGTWHSCALSTTGQVRCWGDNLIGATALGTNGIIGDDEHPSAVAPIDFGGDAQSVTKLVVGPGHNCVLHDNRKIECWGANNKGQLGYGHTNNIGDDELMTSVGTVSFGASFIDVAVGMAHSCAVTSTGKVYCWGDNEDGQLGYGHTNNIGDDELASSDGPVSLGGDAVQVAAGQSHTCVLLVGGLVKCWGVGAAVGLGYEATIGDDETPDQIPAVEVGGTVVKIAAGHSHTCALLETGALRCWGSAQYGKLGYGNEFDIGDNETPDFAGDVPVGGVVVDVSAGTYHTCARMQSGGIRCWGRGSFGALGYGSTENIGDDETPATIGDVSVE